MNKFAETNQDIVEGMKRSAATFAALGQTWTDSFAIFTGAQEVIQNAETVGTALKTLSLRVRGYSEETEELDSELANITGEVIDLTKTASNPQGISLFTDASQEHYKSMVEYLGEISDIWDELDEKSQTDLLEKLFGKRGASVGSAILGNFDTVEKALQEMENAAGAADAEMSIIQESIDYKLNALKETWVGTVQEIVDRGDIGTIIDALTKLSEAIGFVADKAGLLGTIGTIGAGIAGAKGQG